MSKDRPSIEELAFRGLANFRQPTDAEIQAGINAAMRDVIRHDTRNVHDRPNPYLQEKLPAKSAGSAGERPLTQPPGIEIIDRLCSVMLPHGPESKAK